ncbi:hypothetical protein ACF064_01580 [Streptomyces sp. NPDC015492]|uniref:hypothetical protein n=1 Tax=Streptomyces sp. NPDC015492 TaxID=3364958 RepID=UPI003702C009
MDISQHDPVTELAAAPGNHWAAWNPASPAAEESAEDRRRRDEWDAWLEGHLTYARSAPAPWSADAWGLYDTVPPLDRAVESHASLTGK